MLHVSMKKSKSITVSKALFLSVILLLVTGAGYRVMAYRLNLVTNAPALLDVPLKEFPLEISGWVGADIFLPDYIKEMSGNGDLLYRSFWHRLTGQWVNVYVSYSGSSGTMLGHQPRACYVADGWLHEKTVSTHFTSAKGKTIPCLIHRFHKGISDYKEVVVMNFYIFNGQITSREKDFFGVKRRVPNISNNPLRYMAQVQISSDSKSSILAAAEDMADVILDFFPDENGIITAKRYFPPGDDILN